MNGLSASANCFPTNKNQSARAGSRNNSLYNSKIAAKISPYLAIEDCRNFAISGKEQQKLISDYWQVRIEQSGLMDIEATITTKINFIRQFENTSEAKENILFMSKIGFSKQQTLSINRREIDQIREDYTFTKAVLDWCNKNEGGNQITREQLIGKLTLKNLWSADKEGKLNNLIAVVNRIKFIQNNGQLYLAFLRLKSGDLAALIPEIQKISNLTRLDVSRNRLQVLPASIGSLTVLTTLNVSVNQLKFLPESIGGLIDLKRLDVSDNQIQVLPECIGSFKALTWLCAGSNQLQVLPESIGSLTVLTKLGVQYNQLRELPASIRELIYLNILNVSHNQLQSLPESIGDLTALIELYVSDNQLKKLPASIGELTGLDWLYVGNNQFPERQEIINILTDRGCNVDL